MPRASGHDGRAVRLLEALENARMALGRMEFDLDLIEMRTRQARTRHPDLIDLLEPAGQTAQEIRKRLERYKAEVDKAIELSNW